jgi:serine/threonine-protein kinase
MKESMAAVTEPATSEPAAPSHPAILTRSNRITRASAPVARRPTTSPGPAAMAPTPTPTPAAAPEPAADKAAADCNPPYYYDGAKKVFKPQCL